MQETSKQQRSWYMLLGHYWVHLHSRGAHSRCKKRRNSRGVGICYVVTIGFTCTPAVRIRDARDVETAEELVYVTWLLFGPRASPRCAFVMQETLKQQRSWDDTRCLVCS